MTHIKTAKKIPNKKDLINIYDIKMLYHAKSMSFLFQNYITYKN
jgi:hypothetical protein